MHVDVTNDGLTFVADIGEMDDNEEAGFCDMQVILEASIGSRARVVLWFCMCLVRLSV